MHKRRIFGWILLVSAAIMALSKASPCFAEGVYRAVLLPVNGFLSALIAKAPLPVAEGAVLFLCAFLVYCAMCRKGRAVLYVFAVAVCTYAVFWYPAYFAPSANPWPVAETTDMGRIAALCERLIGELDASAETTFMGSRLQTLPERDLSEAFAEIGLQMQAFPSRTAVYKTAAYKPVENRGWMRKLSLAGVYVPWTREALVDTSLPAWHFTACHETAHLLGVADEGQANIAAWKVCMALGGDYARDARLWALRYALPRLKIADKNRWEVCVSALSADDFSVLWRMGAFSDMPDAQNHWARLLGLGERTENYALLVDRLCMEVCI